jgi:hypothetical protein
MTNEQLIGAWVLFAAGFVACSVVILVAGVVAIAQEGRPGGARSGRSRPEAGGMDGSSRRGEGSPRRVFTDEFVAAFLLGEITLDDVRDFHNGRKW